MPENDIYALFITLGTPASNSTDHCVFLRVIGSFGIVLLKAVISRLGCWAEQWGSGSFKGVLVTERSIPHPTWPIASKVIQNVCNDFFQTADWPGSLTSLGKFLPDNVHGHTGWARSPDLAAPANSRGEWKTTFPLICSICWGKSSSPSLPLIVTLSLLFYLGRR